jgi:hypothetical protein
MMQNGGKYAHSVPAMGCGTVSKMTPHGQLATLVNFKGAAGGQPFAVVVQGPDCPLSGTTLQGGRSPMSKF